MKLHKFFCTLLLAGLLFMSHWGSVNSQENQGVNDLVALIKAKAGLDVKLDDVGWTWREQDFSGNLEQGRLEFSDRKWLMYLIHWGPIQTPRITVEYVKKRMLDMWGVKFEFSGKEGEMMVARHDAVWVEAYGTNKISYARFIVWNCPQSRREFIADTNYNLRYKTPPEDLELERTSILSISCHEGAVNEPGAALDNRFYSKKYGLAFDYPGSWFIADSPFYVPSGKNR